MEKWQCLHWLNEGELFQTTQIVGCWKQKGFYAGQYCVDSMPCLAEYLIVQTITPCYKLLEKKKKKGTVPLVRRLGTALEAGFRFAVGFKLDSTSGSHVQTASHLLCIGLPSSSEGNPVQWSRNIARTHTWWKMALRPDSAIFTIPLANSVSVEGQSELDTRFTVTEVGLSKPEVIPVNKDHSGKKKFWPHVFVIRQKQPKGLAFGQFLTCILLLATVFSAMI